MPLLCHQSRCGGTSSLGSSIAVPPGHVLPFARRLHSPATVRDPSPPSSDPDRDRQLTCASLGGRRQYPYPATRAPRPRWSSSGERWPAAGDRTARSAPARSASPARSAPSRPSWGQALPAATADGLRRHEGRRAAAALQVTGHRSRLTSHRVGFSEIAGGPCEPVQRLMA